MPYLVKRLPVSFNNLSPDFKLRRFLAGRGVPLEVRHHRWLGSFFDEQKESLIQDWVKPVLNYTYAPAQQALRDCDARLPLNKVLHLDMKLYLEGDILYKVDRASMANSLEVRVPFLNRKIVDFICRLPLNLKLHGLTSKYLLKKSMVNYLPGEVINRPKKGFNMPVAQWINGQLREMVWDTLSPDMLKKHNLFNANYVQSLLEDHASHRADNRKLLWTLLMFQLWYDKYMVQ